VTTGGRWTPATWLSRTCRWEKHSMKAASSGASVLGYIEQHVSTVHKAGAGAVEVCSGLCNEHKTLLSQDSGRGRGVGAQQRQLVDAGHMPPGCVRCAGRFATLGLVKRIAVYASVLDYIKTHVSAVQMAGTAAIRCKQCAVSRTQYTAQPRPVMWAWCWGPTAATGGRWTHATWPCQMCRWGRW
jgi:hypothetical protein